MPLFTRSMLLASTASFAVSVPTASEAGDAEATLMPTRVDAVTPTKMDVEVALLAVDKRAVGATAHLLTTYRTEGDAKGRYRVSGRLLLTKDDGHWTVFAYHVSKGGR